MNIRQRIFIDSLSSVRCCSNVAVKVFGCGVFTGVWRVESATTSGARLMLLLLIQVCRIKDF